MTNGTATPNAAPQLLEAAQTEGFAGSAGQLPIGRRDRQHGSLRTLVDIYVTAVLEAADDLAIADRVAFVIARRTHGTCLVIATAHTFVIAACDQELTLADAATLQACHPTDRIVSIATPEGLAPVLEPMFTG
jgi:hypothetical protein